MATRGATATAIATSSWVLPLAEVSRWFKGARAGDKLVYGRGPCLIQGETSVYVRGLYEQGLADLRMPRSAEGGGYDYTVQKSGGAAAAAAGGDGDEEDPALDAIFRRLKRAANFDERCPSDTELAREAGLPTKARAAWRIRKLVKAGRIKVDTIEAGREAGYRTVTIVETKKQTLPPPSLRALKRSVRECGE